MATSAESLYLEAAIAGLRPDPLLSVSEWADEHRILSSRASAEPGIWRTARTPYLREIMDCLSPAVRWERIVFMKGAQIGATEAGNNWIGYVIHKCPGPMMAVQPTTDMAKRLSKQRIDPLIEDSPELRARVSDPRARDAGNTMLAKEFPGGILVMTGANSAVGLRSMPVRFLFLDEVDGYPSDIDGEGDPVNLAIARTRTFPRRKIFIPSTPSLRGVSRIESLFEESDQRYYLLPCPHCMDSQPLLFEQMRWAKGKPRNAKYHCRACGKVIEEHAKTWMLERGAWKPSTAGDERTAGFHLSSLYSPLGWYSWADAAEQYEKAGRSATSLQVFWNTVLGLPWAEAGETPEAHRLYERRESYPIGRVPVGAGALTAGVDVQARRLEVEILAWGPHRESWSIDYRVFEGDTSQPDVWKHLTALLDEWFPCQTGGKLQIMKIAVDSGFNTMAVYNWARLVNSSRVMVVKGESRATALLGSSSAIEVGPQGQRVRFGIRLWPVNTGIAKEELYRWLRLPAPQIEAGEAYPPGYCHFPEYALMFFEQLCAEKLMTRVVHGYQKRYWQQIQERNEALDCRIYARAAALAARVDFWTETRWKELLEDLILRSVDEQPRRQQLGTIRLSEVPKFQSHMPEDPYLD
jgi:phage terminase large subunit GpA-like protein